ncbi:MAG TPA: hypothetical protein VFP54_11315 [Acidimicrobiales bacterium]|nr:hypothetical protein [Acidimicrobiales bacterium]
MVILLLALVWAAVILPPLVRKGAEGHAMDSVWQFSRRMRLLDRASPSGISTTGLGVLGAATRARPLLEPERPLQPSSLPLVRAKTIRRRRTVMAVLTGFFFVLTVVAAATGSAMALTLDVLDFLATAAYVVALVNVRARVAERDMKLRFLPSVTEEEFSSIVILRSTASESS